MSKIPRAKQAGADGKKSSCGGWIILGCIALAALLPRTLPGQSRPPQSTSGAVPASMQMVDAAKHDPAGGAPSAAPEFTLDQLQKIALANNPTLGQAQAEVRAAAGRTRQAGLWPNPSIGYTGEEIRGGSYNGGQQGAFVQQDVILGGKLGLARKVTAAEGKQAEAEVEEQRLRIRNGVRMAFYQSLAAQQMVAMRKKMRALASDAAKTTEQLYNTGQADEPDMLQARVEADEAELAVVNARQERQRAWQVLAAVVGRPEWPLARLSGNFEDFPQLDTKQLLATILKESPSEKIAELGVARALAASERARREVIPDISVRAGYLDNREQLGNLSPTPVGSEGFAELSVHLRLFDRNQGGIQAAKAEEERASLEVQRLGLVLRQLAAPYMMRYTSSLARAELYRKSTLPSAQRAYELYLRKYGEGAAAWPQVLIAQRTFFQLQADYISTVENVWTSAVPLQGLLLTDGLDMPSRPGELDLPVREVNLPVQETPGSVK